MPSFLTTPVELATTVERGPIHWASAPPAWAMVLLLLAVALGIRAVYRREEGKIPPLARFGLASLRTLAVVLVLLTLFKPFQEETQKAEDKSHLVVLVDASASMKTQDRYKPADEQKLLEVAYPEGGSERRPNELHLSRMELVQRVLSPEGDALLRRLSERYVLHVYAFDEDLRSLGSTDEAAATGEGQDHASTKFEERVAVLGRLLRETKPSGGRTELGAALLGIARDALGRDDRRLAGVVLVSDGRDNSDAESPLDAVNRLGKSAEDLHLAAVALGDPGLAKNLSVDHVAANEIILVQDIADFQIDLKQIGFDGVNPVEVRLEIEQVAEPDGKKLTTKKPYAPPFEESVTSTKVRLLPSDRTTSVSLRAQFTEPGTFDVTVRAILPERERREDAIPADDFKIHHIRVKGETIRVLLCDWNLRHESWFLKNLLVRESRHRGAPRRIDAQVYVQSFDPDVEQPHSHALPALKSFPTTRQEIFSYDVILLGDVNWRLLAGPNEREEKATQILNWLKEFVAEGGGLGFIAGEDRNPSQLATTPLSDVLPIVLRPADSANPPNPAQEFRLAPTEVGRVHKIMGSVVPGQGPEAVDKAWRERDGWNWFWLYRATGGMKPGAVALAKIASGASAANEYRDDRGELLPAFIVMPYGKGRVFFSAIDDIFRIRRATGDLYYGSFWDATIRWLATYRLLGGSKLYKIETDKDKYFVNETAQIRITALDTDYRPLKVPRLAGVQVEDPDGKPMLLPGEEPVPEAEAPPGTYGLRVRLPRSGPYRITVEPASREGGERAEKPIEAKFATKEDQDTLPNHDGLKALVRAANPAGRGQPLVSLWELPAFLDRLPPQTTERVLDRREVQLWDTSTPLLLVAIVLALEWIWRKRYQLI